MLLQGKSFSMYNVKQSEEFLSKMDERYVDSNVECIISLPIVVPKTQQLLGVLEYINKASGPPLFEPEDESLLLLISSFWVFVLGNARLRDGSGQAQELRSAFSDVASAILVNQSDFEGLISSLQKTTCRLLRAEVCEFCSLDKQAGGLRSLKPSEADEFLIPLSTPTIPCKCNLLHLQTKCCRLCCKNG
jgi:hypothetical protein